MKIVEQTRSKKAIRSEDDIDFQKIWSVLKRRWLPATGVFVAVITLTAPAILLQKPVYETTGKLLIKPDNTPSLTGVEKEIKDPGILTKEDNPLKTEAEIVVSTPLLKTTITSLNLKDQQGKLLTADFLKTQIEVKNVAGTDVLEIAHKNSNPEQAAAVVNELMLFYIQKNITNNRAKAVATRKFIARQLPKTELAVRKTDIALRSFKEQNKVVDLGEEAESAVEAGANIDDQITKAQAGLAKVTARTEELRNQVGMKSKDAVAVSSLNQASGVQEVLKEFQQVESQLALEQTRYYDQHPNIVNLRNKREVLRNLLQQRVQQNLGSQQQVPDGELQGGDVKKQLTEDLVQSEAERLGLVDELASLSQAKQVYQQRANSLPILEQKQRQLERQLEAAQDTYKALLRKLQEVNILENQSIGNASILEAASIPEKPSLSKKTIVLFLAGGLLAIIFSATTILILEVRDKSVKNLKEAREIFEYTFLGAIPNFSKVERITRNHHLEQHPEIVVRDIPYSTISEAFRMLQANLEFLSSDEEVKVVLVTSSVPQEGKSTVVANLASAVAELGQRVLLVDADMRHPVQHSNWELNNHVGLSNILVGKAKLNMAVKEVMLNVDVLTSGVIPPNPIALLKSKRMAALIKSFSEDYDFVIIDAPPLVVAADALILGKMTNGVLLVTRPGVVDYASAAASRESLERSGQNVLGLVVNGVVSESKSDGYFYHGQEYHSGTEDFVNIKEASKPRVSYLNTMKVEKH